MSVGSAGKHWLAACIFPSVNQIGFDRLPLARVQLKVGRCERREVFAQSHAYLRRTCGGDWQPVHGQSTMLALYLVHCSAIDTRCTECPVPLRKAICSL